MRRLCQAPPSWVESNQRWLDSAQLGSAQLVIAHIHFHLCTTCLPSPNLARQALLFLSLFLLSFFVPPISPVFYLIEL